MANFNPKELVAALKRVQEGEHPRFQAAIQPDIDHLDRSIAAGVTPKPNGAPRATRSQQAKKRPDGLEMLAMCAKLVAEEDYPEAAGPSIVAAPAVVVTAPEAAAVVENGHASPADQVKDEPTDADVQVELNGKQEPVDTEHPKQE